ncbi:MAG: hypothetical protein ABSH41_24575, partial [Syntrophobacteraceae bacterium]
MNKGIKAISIWAVVIIADLLIASVCAELWVRLLVPVKNVQYIFDDKIGVRFTPNQRTYGYVENGYSNILLTNSLGMHDVERNLKKSVNSCRVQVYGNSVIVGVEVKIEETVPSYLEKFMNQYNRGEWIEVMNMACGDDGTPSQLLTYQEIGRRFSPDLVVCFFMDDFANNIIETCKRDYSPHCDIDGAGELRFLQPKPKDLSTPWEQLKKKSLLCKQITIKFFESKMYQDLMLALNLNLFIPHGYSWLRLDEYRKDICLEKALPVTLNLIRRFRDVVERDGARFVVIDGCKFSGKYVGTVFQNNDFEQFCRVNSIAYIPAYKRQLELDENSPKYYFKNLHLNSEGNQEVARFAADQLIKFFPTSTAAVL